MGTMKIPSQSLALSRVAKSTMANGFLLLVIGIAVILALSVFTMLPQSSVVLLPNQQQSAYATFPGSNGKIAFDRREGGHISEIWIMNADGSGETRLTSVAHDPLFIHPGDIEPTWSPDGTKIAFSSHRDYNFSYTTRTESEIYVMNADGSDVNKLTNEFESDGYPSWSPDGTKIAFVSKRDESWCLHQQL
jgi:dipeptidyl aminopeptidase/acylaminoacyl peptidase